LGFGPAAIQYVIYLEIHWKDMHIPRLMRVLVVTMLFAFALMGGTRPAVSSPGKVSTLMLFGREHVRLGDWAKANNFEIRWLKKDKLLQLSSRLSKLVLEVDSRQAELNGINVWLSHSVALYNGSPCISALDLQTTIIPVLSPPRNRSGGKIKKIVIDPGHGGTDPGFQDGSRQEKKYTLLLAQELCSQLKQAGFDASLTRSTDMNVDRSMRPELAKRRAADLFISLHWNSAGSARNEVKGVETYCLTPAGASSTNAGGDVINAGVKLGNRYNEKNIFLAYQIHKALLNGLGVEDRGVRRARFEILRTAEMPAVLIEGGFMSNPSESKRIYDSAYRKQMAQSIVNGVTAYKKQVEQVKGK
jgi:N-acetylmuramoyl-L-alanine amidase